MPSVTITTECLITLKYQHLFCLVSLGMHLQNDGKTDVILLTAEWKLIFSITHFWNKYVGNFDKMFQMIINGILQHVSLQATAPIIYEPVKNIFQPDPLLKI